MKLADLRSQCKQWQDQLGLKDWDITVRWAKPSDGMEDDCNGHAFWFTEKQSALILLRKKPIAGAEHAHTMLHEILHITLEGWRPSAASYSAFYELGINRITDALIGRKEAYAPDGGLL